MMWTSFSVRSRSFTRCVRVIVAAGLAATALATPLHAAEPGAVEDARRLYVAGRQAFDEGRLDVAATSFAAAYRLQPRPGLLWNLGETYRRQFLLEQSLEALRRAVDAYRRYLTSGAHLENRNEAERLLAELTPILLRLQPPSSLESNSPPAPVKTELLIVADAEHATVAIDGQPPAPAPLLTEVAPGHHHALVASAGYFPLEMSVMAVSGRLVTAEARLSPRPGTLQVEGPRGARLYIDQSARGMLPLPSLELPAGTHGVALIERGRQPWTAQIDLARGGHTALAAVLTPTRQRRAAKWLAISGAGTAVAAAVLGGLWGQADASASALNRQLQLTDGQLSSDQYGDYLRTRDRRDELRIASGVLIGVTAAIELTAGALYLFDVPRVR
jgi:hypothetical protein